MPDTILPPRIQMGLTLQERNALGMPAADLDKFMRCVICRTPVTMNSLPLCPKHERLRGSQDDFLKRQLPPVPPCQSCSGAGKTRRHNRTEGVTFWTPCSICLGSGLAS